MQWLECTVPGGDDPEELCNALAELGVGGMSIENERDFHDFLENNRACWDYVDEALEESFSGVSCVKFWLSCDAEGEKVLAAVRAAGYSVETRVIADEDWENNWKQYYQPLPIGEKLLVVPEWLHPENPEHRVEVLLDPGMIFGTGAHASTQMCMEELERAIQGGEEVLDLGSGSGILSITALLLGAQHATGVDIDPKAEDIARQNAAINQLGPDRFTALTGDVIGDTAMMEKLKKSYDIVLANIVADVIIPLAPAAASFLSEDSVFICSGILNTRLPEVLSALEKAGMQILSTQQQDDWCRVTAALA